jgi:hypothetical protein
MASRRKNANKNDAVLDVDELDAENGDDVPEVENLTLGPIENSDEVPLFANKYSDMKRAIHALKIVKLDQPGAGYKGELPKNSTLETIANMFGDGLYNIEAINAGYKVLRVMQNVRIALSTGGGLAAGAGSGQLGARPGMGAVVVSGTDKEALDRVERLASAAGLQAAQQARDFTSLVTTTVQSAAERERAFMQGVQENSQVFFGNLLAMQTQGFQQVLALMQAGHQQTMEAVRASSTQNNPNDLIRLLVSGIQMGRDMDEPEETPFWQELLQGGVGLLGNFKQQQGGNVQLPPPVKVPAIGQGKAEKKVVAAAKNPGNKRKEAKQLLRLYRALRSRGMDIEQVTAQLEGRTMQENKAQSQSTETEAPDLEYEEQAPDDDTEDLDDDESDDDESDDGSEDVEGTGEPDTDAHP